MRIGIIGAGRLGRALGARLADAGHQLMYAGGASAAEAASASGARAGSNSDTVAFADVVVLTVPFEAAGAALAQAGPLEGTVLWSCVNALKPDFSGLALGFDNSGAEEVANYAPGARVVAAIPPFAETLASCDLRYNGGLSPTVFVCGDDQQAKTLVEQLLTEIGAHTVDAGPLTTARLIEPTMMLLVSIAYAGVPRDVSLRLLERRA